MGTVPYKEILSAIAIALTFAAFVPYNNAINSDSVKRREKHAPLYTAGYGER